MYEKRYTYKEISKITGKSISNIRSLAHKLNIERYLVKGTTKMLQESVDIIVAHFEPKTPRTENGRYKIRVIERYLKSNNYRDVARTCNISRVTVKLIIEEFERDGYITVGSSINFRDKIQNKGIFKKGSKWGYCLVNKGTKYYKSGFDYEFEVVEELARLKESLR